MTTDQPRLSEGKTAIGGISSQRRQSAKFEKENELPGLKAIKGFDEVSIDNS